MTECHSHIGAVKRQGLYWPTHIWKQSWYFCVLGTQLILLCRYLLHKLPRQICGKQNCSIWMLSNWIYFGDVLGEEVEVIKNIHHGLWGRHHIDIPATVSLLRETFRTAAGTSISLQLWHLYLTKPMAHWNHHQCPPLPSWDLCTAVKRASQLSHKICDCCITLPALLCPAVFRTCCTLCTWRNWFVPYTVWTLRCMTFMCSVPSRKH